ncbi:MAG TPA: response regulator [Candidatus Marinimicrobia bacterium]|nr:response regulator [Candidatus Neomarinimicrobiota bacterium]
MLENRILIVDDDPDITDIISKTLSLDGFTNLNVAHNGEQALEIFGHFGPDLVILDLRMPVMTGYDFLKEVNLKPADPYAVIVLSGEIHDEAIKQCYDLRINAYLYKPFNLYALRGIVKQTLALKNVQADLEEEIMRRKELEKQLREDRLHFMSLAKDKLTPGQQLERMQELVIMFEDKEN